METDLDPASTGHDEIGLLVSDVIAASKLPVKARGIDVKPTVAKLTSLAYEWGILPDALDGLINLVTTPNYLDQASQAAIIRNLYPVAPVSRSVVLRVVSALGHGGIKPSLTLQAALLKWIIMVYHILESPQVLSQAYSVLFNLLDTAAILPHLSHVLVLVTRRRHVRPFRIQALLNMSRQTGNDPHLTGLLRVFKDYYPEVIVGEAVRGKASSFKHPDSQWRARLDEIQEAHLQQSLEGVSRPRDGFRVSRPVGRRSGKRTIPLVHTSYATEASVTLEEIENAAGFVKNIDKLELPNQLVAVLADPLLQKMMLLRPSYESDQRIANWLNAVLQDVVSGDADENTLFELLDVLRDYVVSIKKLPLLVLDFFARFLQFWNGAGPSVSLFEILSYSPLLSFQELYQHVFQPLETATLDNTVESQLALLNMYRDLLHHWIVFLESADSVPADAGDIITSLIRHVNSLCLAIVQNSPTVPRYSAVLDFYEQTVQIITHEHLKNYIPIELPPSHLIYILFFSPSSATVSRMCAILASYKKGFELAMLTKPRNDGTRRINSSTYSRVSVSLFNGYLMDMCNAIWRDRAFGNKDTNSHGCMIPRALVSTLSSYVASVNKDLALASLFGLSNSPILGFQSMQCMKELEDAEVGRSGFLQTRHEGPVTQSSLSRLESAGGTSVSWQTYRIKVLETLSAKELAGITDLLKNTMTILRNAMDGTGGTR